MRILALDYGTRRIGLALSDEGAVLASPLPALARRGSEQQDMAALRTLLREEGVVEVVVGWPLHANGSRGEMARQAEWFAERLRAVSRLPVQLFDERFTSQQAERAMIEGDLSRRRRRELRDSLAAVLILQAYLDRRHGPPTVPEEASRRSSLPDGETRESPRPPDPSPIDP